MAVLTDNMRGALLMTVAMAAFTMNDAFMKGLSDELPLFQSIFLRGLIVVPLMVVLCLLMGQFRFSFSRRDWRLMLIRTGAEMGGAYLFITALFNMPIANVSAILQSLPLTVSLVAALVFREPLGWRRFTAILVGFAGVMLIVRPGGSDFNVYSLYALAAVAMVTVRDLAARRMSAEVPSTIVALVAAVGVMLMAGVGLAIEEWQPVTGQAWIQLTGAGVLIIGGYIFSVSSMRVGELGFVAPFRYTGLLVAIILGMVVFGEFPKPLTILGAAIVVMTGLFTLYRERILRIRRAKLSRPGA